MREVLGCTFWALDNTCTGANTRLHFYCNQMTARSEVLQELLFPKLLYKIPRISRYMRVHYILHNKRTLNLPPPPTHRPSLKINLLRTALLTFPTTFICFNELLVSFTGQNFACISHVFHVRLTSYYLWPVTYYEDLSLCTFLLCPGQMSIAKDLQHDYPHFRILSFRKINL